MFRSSPPHHIIEMGLVLSFIRTRTRLSRNTLPRIPPRNTRLLRTFSSFSPFLPLPPLQNTLLVHSIHNIILQPLLPPPLPLKTSPNQSLHTPPLNGLAFQPRRPNRFRKKVVTARGEGFVTVRFAG